MNLFFCSGRPDVTNELVTFPILKIRPRKKWVIVVYYESIKRELKIKSIYECRCDERLQTKIREVTRLAYTGLAVELEHLKIETRLKIDKFVSEMGEYVTER